MSKLKIKLTKWLFYLTPAPPQKKNSFSACVFKLLVSMVQDVFCCNVPHWLVLQLPKRDVQSRLFFSCARVGLMDKGCCHCCPIRNTVKMWYLLIYWYFSWIQWVNFIFHLVQMLVWMMVLVGPCVNRDEPRGCGLTSTRRVKLKNSSAERCSQQRDRQTDRERTEKQLSQQSPGG